MFWMRTLRNIPGRLGSPRALLSWSGLRIVTRTEETQGAFEAWCESVAFPVEQGRIAHYARLAYFAGTERATKQIDRANMQIARLKAIEKAAQAIKDEYDDWLTEGRGRNANFTPSAYPDLFRALLDADES